MRIKVALIEDNDMLAESIREKLEMFYNDIEFVFRAKNGNELISKLEENISVDVILMDIEMPVMNGIEATEVLNKEHPQIKVVILTVFDDEEKIFKSIQAGASGYLLKDEKPERILEAIKLIIIGGAPMSPSIAAKTLNLLRNPGAIKPEIKENYKLTQRECDVLKQISKGLNYNKISQNLFISPSTVRKHIENIYKKLQVHNRVQAIQKAIKHKLI